MAILNTRRSLVRDIERIKTISSKIDKKISEIKPSDAEKIDKLTLEELGDLNKIVGIADFMLCKYAENKDMHSILKHFVSIISDTAKSLDGINDEISELILSAEDSINKVKDIHTHISDRSEIKSGFHNGSGYDVSKTSGINLTNPTTEINIPEYQQNSQEQTT